VGAPIGIETLHHVSLPTADLERSKRFYNEVLGLEEISRPPFDNPGAWFALGDAGQLHLILSEDQTFRSGDVNPNDVHFAIRVGSFRRTLEWLRSQGYGEDAAGLMKLDVRPTPVTGFPQLYMLDPDRNVVELNADTLDM
jgi:catechol 2,3-dioxygenase-like lactoylglutathione lyase family enzyme